MIPFQNVTEAAKNHRKIDGVYTYGTAGFRYHSSKLDSVIFRVGLLAVLRSKAKDGQVIGVMVTASHNPVQDNGVKLIDPMGEMLEESWEKHATDVANCKDEDLPECLQQIVSTHKIDIKVDAKIVIGRDTRPSGPSLFQSLKDGIAAMNAVIVDCGVLTTPQLHYIVRCFNTNNKYGDPTTNGYYSKLSNAFENLLSMQSDASSTDLLKVDGANGIGALAMKEMLKHLDHSRRISIFNDASSGVLNEKCGADFVKVQQKAPDGFEYENNDRCVSFDGDADRIVYFYKDDDSMFHLLDGDKIATLIAEYLKKKLDLAKINLQNGLGVIQTAYANGSSTEFLIEAMKVPVALTKTGVKHLHHKAKDFDIGVYFEANGHGTILFSDEAESRIRSMAADSSDQEKQKAAICLSHFIDLTNQTVGDAISDMLIVECILHEKKWTCSDWDKCYQDLPNKQSKVKVKDRTIIQTTNAETRTISPAGLQEKIDSLTKTINKGRSFVRPSGTEDVVRVYAEAETKEMTMYLSAAVSQLVFDMCNGEGERPVVPEFPKNSSKRKLSH